MPSFRGKPKWLLVLGLYQLILVNSQKVGSPRALLDPGVERWHPGPPEPLGDAMFRLFVFGATCSQQPGLIGDPSHPV